MAQRFSRPEPPTLAANLSTKKRGWTNKRVSSLKLQATGWTPKYPTYPDALEHDRDLVPSILEQAGDRSKTGDPFPYGDYVFVFDKDGVLFNSEPIKLAAFESLFKESPTTTTQSALTIAAMSEHRARTSSSSFSGTSLGSKRSKNSCRK